MNNHQPFLEIAGNNPQPFSLHDLATASMEAIHEIDFLDRSFLYVADRPFFLYGYTPEEVKKMGFDFFKKVVHEEDLPLLKKIYAAIQRHEQLPEINYFSFTLRLKNEITGYIMVDHKLKPAIVDGQVRFGLCMLAVSILETTGNLRAYYHNSRTYFDEYAPENKKWQKKTQQMLTMQEKAALIWAKQGKTQIQIADKMKVKHQSVKNILSKLYDKLKIYSITQAINLTNHLHLIFTREQQECKEAEEMETSKKQRRPLTSEKLERIQDALNMGKSVNSIAKQENVSESAIRYHIDQGKLKKPQIHSQTSK